MKKRSIAWLALVCAVCMLMTILSACGNSSNPASSSSAASGGSSVSSAAASSSTEKVTLRMIDSLASDTRTAAIQKIIDDYKSVNPNVSVELISPPTEGADAKIQQMLMSNEQLDIIDTGNSFQASVNNGWIQPLNSYVSSWSELSTLTTEAQTCAVKLDPGREKMYCMPYGIYEKLLFYRTDWFKELGLNPPTTWQEIYDDAVALQKAGHGGWATRGGTRGYAVFDMLLLSYIGQDKLVNDDNYLYFLKDGTNIFSTDAAKEALKFYKSLYKDASPADSISWGFTEMVQAFMNGQAGLLIQDNDVINSLSDGMDSSTWSATALPLGPSGQGNNPLGYGGWALTAKCEHPKEAADFIMYLSSAEKNGYFCEQTGLIPIHTTTFEQTKQFSTGVYQVFADMSSMKGKYIYSYAGAVGYDAAATFGDDRDEYIQKYLMGQISEDDVLNYWSSTWVKAVKDQGELWNK